MIAPQTVLQNRYLVINQIGQGGMGAVYIATDQRFGSTVALKETFFTEPALRKAFEREAHLLNRLRHPALPNVSDHFLEDEGQFLVMEFIAGEDLSEMLKARGGAFPLKEVLGWADQLLDALDYLHTQSQPVIHRDIKPQNLKLTSRGQIILLDFGLAKGTPLQVSQATATGSIFGYSRNYAPIEQIQGTGTDPRSDLYSLAATLYHLMTGVPPPDALSRATEVLNGQPDPLRPANVVHGQITPAVAEVLMRAMSQNAGQRPQSAAAMREALNEAAKKTLVTGGTTSAHAIATATLLEQNTELLGTHSVGADSGVDASQDQTAHIIAGQAATNVDAASSTKAVSKPTHTSLETPDSEITEFKKAHSGKRSRSGRTVGIAIGAVVVLVLAAVVFAMTRLSATPPAETPPPADVSNPATNNQTQQTTTDPNPANTSTSTTQEDTAQKSQTETKGTSTPVPPKATATVPTPNPPDRNSREAIRAEEERRAREREREIINSQVAEEQRRAEIMERRAEAARQRAERERRQSETFRRRQRSRRPGNE